MPSKAQSLYRLTRNFSHRYRTNFDVPQSRDDLPLGKSVTNQVTCLNVGNDGYGETQRGL